MKLPRNTAKYPIPERCCLRQTLLWVSKGTLPIPDNIFIAAPGPTDFDGPECKQAAADIVRRMCDGDLPIAGRPRSTGLKIGPSQVIGIGIGIGRGKLEVTATSQGPRREIGGIRYPES